MNSFILKSIVASFLAVLLSSLYLFMPQTIFSLDNYIRDFMFTKRGELKKIEDKGKPQVIIIDIDEKSLKEFGQWPWQRDVVADLLYKLTDAGAGIIGLDIIFAEEDRSSPHRLALKYPSIKEKLENYDDTLANCLLKTPVIGGYVFNTEYGDGENSPTFAGVFIDKNSAGKYIIESKGVFLNIEKLQDAMYSIGFFNVMPDEDGMVRRAPMIINYDEAPYPSLALEMVRIYSGEKVVNIQSDSELGMSGVSFGKYKIPTDIHGRFTINFRGKGGYYKYISASDILNGNFSVSDIKNNFILVGTSAIGLHDLRSTVYDLAIPGVEIHANIIDNILSGDYLYKPAEMTSYDITIIWAIVFVSLILLSFIKSWFSIPFSIMLLYGLFELFYKLLFENGLVFNLLFPFLAYITTLMVSIFIDYIIASKQKEQAKRMLGKKVSPAVMEYLLEHSQEDLVSPREIEATILFSDIRGFTSISEKIGSPDKLIHLLNTYMTPMVDNVVSHKGTIDKFIGDAIMAYWNAPIKVPNHADSALESAIEQIEMLNKVNKIITPKYDVTIAIGIGIHTGIVTAGDMGSYGRSDYTIIGDNVNLASRLEGLTKQYTAQILISHATYLQLKGKYKIRPIDLVEVKGKKEAVEIYEVLCNNKVVTDEEMLLYAKATKLFRAGEIKEAYKLYTQLQDEQPSVLYEFYKKRCEKFIENPALEFTPILTMTTK